MQSPKKHPIAMVYLHSSIDSHAWGILRARSYTGICNADLSVPLHNLHPLWISAACFALALHTKFPLAQAEVLSRDKRNFYSTEGQEI